MASDSLDVGGLGARGDSIFSQKNSHHSALSLLILQNFGNIYIVYSLDMSSLSFVSMYCCMKA